jgi:hypothetical protein
MDNILIVYSKDTTNIYDVFNVFNIIPTMKFTIEEEKKESTS